MRLRFVPLCTLFILFLPASKAHAQELSDSFNLISGSLNLSVILATNTGINAQPNSDLFLPLVVFTNIQIGYQYIVGKNWGVNTSFCVGYQPFKFRTIDKASKDVFNETVFMMPYFGLCLELKRRFNKGYFFPAAANVHVNTLANYSATYNLLNSPISSFNYLYLERNLTEYAGVQHGLGISIGKQITQGIWNGIDFFATALILNRQKLVIDYWTYKKQDANSAYLPTGKISYNGGYLCVGICYNFKN